MAPGRLRTTTGDDQDNFALSRAYLSSAQAVQVTSTVSVRIRTLGPGATIHLHLEPDADRPRVCTLIAGQLQVKMGDGEEFTIGPGGLFVVKPGVVARVQNRLFLDCVLHIVVCDE
jgi:quercetin dioxygenase-like cupin family protein